MVKAPSLNKSFPWTLREFLKFPNRLFAPRYMSLLLTLYLTPTSLENRIFPISKNMCLNWTFLEWERGVSRWTELTLFLPTSTGDQGWEWNPFLVRRRLAQRAPLPVLLGCCESSQGLRSGLSRSLLEPRSGDGTVNTNSILRPEMGEEAGLPSSWPRWTSQPPGTYWAFKEHN